MSIETWPKKIYLAHEFLKVPDFRHIPKLAVTWLEAQVDPSDIEYVRADIAEELLEVLHKFAFPVVGADRLSEYELNELARAAIAKATGERNE